MTSIRNVFRGTFTRFLPGCVSALIAVPLVFAPRTFMELNWLMLWRLATVTGFALAGNVASLLLLRPRLRADADIVGRKTFLAGACSVGIVLIASSLWHGPTSFRAVGLVYAVAGFVPTVVIYLPWLQSRAAALEAQRS